MKRVARLDWRSVFGRVNNSVMCGFRTSKTHGSRPEEGGDGKFVVDWSLEPLKLSGQGRDCTTASRSEERGKMTVRIAPG